MNAQANILLRATAILLFAHTLAGCASTTSTDRTLHPDVQQTRFVGKQFLLAQPATLEKYGPLDPQLFPAGVQHMDLDQRIDTLPAGIRLKVTRVVEQVTRSLGTTATLATYARIESGTHQGRETDITEFLPLMFQYAPDIPFTPNWSPRQLTPYLAAPAPWTNQPADESLRTMVAALQSPDWALRWHAARALRSRANLPADALAALRAATRDPDPDVTLEAQKALDTLPENRAASVAAALAQLAPNSGESDFHKNAAVELIGYVGGPALDQLLAAARTQPPNKWLVAAMGAVGPSVKPRLPEMLVVLRGAPADDVAKALLQIDPDAGFRTIMPLVKSDSPDTFWAVEVLSNMAPAMHDAMPAATDMLHSSDIVSRERGLWIAWHLGDPPSATLPRFTEMLRDPDPTVRRMAVYAIGQVATRNPKEKPGIQPSLEAMLADPNYEVRVETAFWLLDRYDIKSQVLRPPVLAALHEPPPANVYPALMNAYTFAFNFPAERPAVKTALRPLLSHPDKDIREGARDILGRL